MAAASAAVDHQDLPHRPAVARLHGVRRCRRCSPAHRAASSAAMSDSQERFRVRMEGTLPIRLTVAEMTPDEALAAVEFLERELQLTQAAAAPALALLQRHVAGDRSTLQWELRQAWRRWFGCSSRLPGCTRRCGQRCRRRTDGEHRHHRRRARARSV